MSRLRVEVWSDVACPWCWVGKRRLEAAMARLPASAEVEVVYRAFELDPRARTVKRPRTSYAERLARKYRVPVAQGQAMVERMTAVGTGEGLELRLDRVRPASTFDAHRLLHLARERGAQAATKERLLRAYFTEGESLGDRETLVRLVAEAGLDAREARDVLEGGAYAAEVRADEEEATRNGIHAVPFFVLDGEYAVAGAQPVDVLHGALAQAIVATGAATRA